MRKQSKTIWKRLLILVLIVTLMPIYTVSADNSNMQLDEQTMAKIQEEYLEIYKKANPDLAAIQKMTAEDILIQDYYGTYSGYAIVQIFFKDVEMRFDEVSIRIGRYEFLFNSSTAPYFFAYKDSEFIPVKDAYEMGLLTANQLSTIRIQFGAEQKWLEPGKKLEQELKNAFWNYLGDEQNDPDYKFENIIVDEYYGNYNGYDIALMFFNNLVTTCDSGEVEIAGYPFTFYSSGVTRFFLAYKDGEMLKVKDAYEQGLLRKEDIIDLAVFRGEIIPPDKCVKHEPTDVGYLPRTAFSQGYTGRVVCEKCYTFLYDGIWSPVLSHTRFADTRTNYWYCTSIDYCDKNGIMVGVDAAHFVPDRTVTRGEFIAALHRLAGKPKAASGNHFADVATDSYYAEAISWGVEQGIVYGTGDTTYSPEQSITREDLACLVARYVKAIHADFLYDDEIYPLPDIPVSDLSEYAKESYALVCNEGIMFGHAGGMFYPKQCATRAEVATVFMNLDEKLKGPEDAYLQVGVGEDAWVYPLPEQDVQRLRELLKLENEVWKEALICECIGECQIILDGMRYIIDWNDLTHQVKYEALYGGVRGAVASEDADILNKLSMMLWNYKFVYELTK